MDIAEFEAELTAALVDELEAWAPRLEGEVMRAFDVGCFPWFETIELSFLTTREKPAVAARPGDDVLAWRLYGFSGKDAGLWTRGKRLLDWLEVRRKSGDDRYTDEELFRACAAAVGSDEVQRALTRYERTDGFVCTVFDPDDRGLFNFCTGAPVEWDEDASPGEGGPQP